MFSPTKAITAGALVAAIGGVLLIAQPFDQQLTSVPGAETEPAPQPAAEFTGHITCGPPIGAAGTGSSETLDVGDEGMVITRYRDGTWRQTIEVDDPRLEGDVYHTWQSDTYRGPEDGSGQIVAASTWRIENDAGAWQGGQLELTLSDGSYRETLTTLVGEGAYEGLTAIVDVVPDDEACGADLRGVIVRGTPVREPYGPE
jgi:hypothetical protein